MAPRHYIGAVVDMYTSRTSSQHLLRRIIPSESLIATVIVLSVMSTLVLASVVFLLSRMWRKAVVSRIESQPSEKVRASAATSGRRPSDWARQNSNVLWSMYIEEDDLKTQFPISPKSRLFSIGSVSTDHGSCPLDRRQSRPNPSNQHKIIDIKTSKTDDSTVDVRARAAYEHQSTPTKTISRARAMSSPSKHRHSNSFEQLAKRKQSLPVPVIKIEEHVKQDYEYYLES